jgi:uncharacterized protein YdhG (YjbR/CyaY superfamily)
MRGLTPDAAVRRLACFVRRHSKRASSYAGSMPKSPRFRSHDNYIAAAPDEVQPLLRQIGATVQALFPEATPCISYNMPAFKLGRTFFYFAAFKQHIGIYPPVRADTTLLDDLAPYLGEKGNLSFPLAKPLPIELIGRVATALSRQCAAP